MYQHKEIYRNVNSRLDGFVWEDVLGWALFFSGRVIVIENPPIPGRRCRPGSAPALVDEEGADIHEFKNPNKLPLLRGKYADFLFKGWK